MTVKTKQLRIVSMVLIVCSLLFTGCSKEKEEADNTPSPTNATDENNKEAFDFVKNLGIGWNLGNTLDSCDYKKVTDEALQKEKMDYQIMGVYSTKEWSAWDASATPYFDVDGKIAFQWEIDKLNSEAGKQCGKLSFQVINHKLGTISDQKLGLTVTKAQFITKDNKVVALSDMQKTYQLSFQDGATEYVEADLTNVTDLVTTSDLIGGTFEVEAEITSYPEPETPDTRTALQYYETLWGNPITTKEMIQKVAEEGFQTVRIPVTYYDHMTDDYTIDEAWLSRVDEIVNYVLDNNLYCIIDVHHDVGEGAWLTADSDKLAENKKNFEKIWTQIATKFQSYDDHVIFEGYNEILTSKNQWGDAGDEAYRTANELNQTFVDTVRNTGGNNATRYLLVNTYAAGGADDIVSAFQIPNDTAKNRLLASIHYYGELDKMDTIFKRLDENMVNKNIPVVIGEFATFTSTKDSINYVTTFLTEAKSRGYAVLWWDRGGNNDTTEGQTTTLLNRTDLTWYDQTLVDTIIKTYKG